MSAVRDTWLVFSRAMLLSLRNPVWVFVGLSQPVIYLAFFGPLLDRLEGTPGFPAGDAWTVFTPGMLVQLALFACGFAGFGIVQELREGVVERMRVTPASRIALLLGRVLRDVTILIVQAALIIGVATMFGMSPDWPGVAASLVMIALLGVVLASVSYAIGLALKSEDALAPLLNSVIVPLLLLSGILLPMSLAPDWLYNLSRVNPLVHIVEATRAMFVGDLASRAVLQGAAVAAVLAVASVALGARTFRRATS